MLGELKTWRRDGNIETKTTRGSRTEQNVPVNAAFLNTSLSSAAQSLEIGIHVNLAGHTPVSDRVPLSQDQ